MATRKRRTPARQAAPASTPDAGQQPGSVELAAESGSEVEVPGEGAVIEPEPEPEPAAGEPVTDYTRAGGHVLTDMGWIPEDQLASSGARPTRVETE